MVKEQKLTKEKATKIIVDNLNKLFKENGLSGIIEVPGAGTMGIFKDDGSKLKILNHAKIEEKKIELEMERTALNWLVNEKSDEKKKIPNYV